MRYARLGLARVAPLQPIFIADCTLEIALHVTYGEGKKGGGWAKGARVRSEGLVAWRGGHFVLQTHRRRICW